MDLEHSHWRNTLRILWIGNFIVGMGYQLIMPFMSLYIEELGHYNSQQLSMWSGLVFGATFLVSSWMAPIWGRFADHHGRKKVMLIAACGMGTMMALMGTVHHVQQLVLLRLLQGFFSGYVSNASALMAANVPVEHSGKALSLLATGTTGGMLFGPLIGGTIANHFGYRLPFFLTGCAYAIVFTLVFFFIKEENFKPIPKGETRSIREVFATLSYPKVIFGMMVTTLIIQASNNSISPIISLYVKELLKGNQNVAFMSGLVAALPGIATLIAAPIFGSLGDKYGPQKVLVAGLTFAILIFIPQAFVTNIWQLAVLRFLVGISDAALLPQVQTMLAKYGSSRYSGRIFSYNQSFQFVGNIIGPLIGSTISSLFGYSGVFISTATLVLINLLWVKRVTCELTHA